MLVHPQFDPVAIDLSRFGIPIAIHWYGITYLVAFALFLWLARVRAARAPFRDHGWNKRDIEDLLFYGVLGVVIGGRLGYVLFYQPGYFVEHPLEILFVWQGGMSFHGGLVGVILAMYLFARQRGIPFFALTDIVASATPIGLLLGRIANFINGELYGRASDVPWAMVFPDPNSGGLPRHPSQLYEAALEGVVLFLLLFALAHFTRASERLGRLSGIFLIGYGVARIIVEFFREPDAQLGYLLGGTVTMGQILSLPMIALGIVLVLRARPAPALSR